jgi:hypothetical protein
MKYGKGFFLVFLLVLVGLCGCDTIDCTLNNTVVMRCGFYKDGKSTTLNETLTITAADTSIVLLNRDINASTLKLALSYFNPVDTLVFKIIRTDAEFTDTVWVEKNSFNHFESPDCPVNMFHNITAVRCTHLFIDSITITAPEVNFKEYEHLQIHFYSSAD